MIKKKKIKRGQPEEKNPEIYFMDINHRKYVEVKMEFEEGTKNITSKVIKEIQKHEIANAVIQINLSLHESDLMHLDINKVIEFLEGELPFFIRPIVPTIMRSKAEKISEITADLEPEEAIRMFIEEYEPEDAEDIEQLALDILRGVEIEL